MQTDSQSDTLTSTESCTPATIELSIGDTREQPGEKKWNQVHQHEASPPIRTKSSNMNQKHELSNRIRTESSHWGTVQIFQIL